MLLFCRRGRQNLRQLKKNDFEIKLDAKGRSFVIKTTDELTKSHRENDEPEDGDVMSNDSPLCPAASFCNGILRQTTVCVTDVTNLRNSQCK